MAEIKEAKQFMTIRELYEMCNNINFDTQTFIVDKYPIWNSQFRNVPNEMLDMKVEYFAVHGNEVRIWIP